MEKIQSFEQFWPFYLSQHQSALNRYLHLAGLTLGLALLIYGAIYHPLLLWLLPVCGYGFSWVGHFFIEKNRPATFQYPLWSFMCDFKMCYLMVTGGLKAELKNVNDTFNAC